MPCKLDAGSNNSYSFTGPNVHSTSIYLGKHCISKNNEIILSNDDKYTMLTDNLILLTGLSNILIEIKLVPIRISNM